MHVCGASKLSSAFHGIMSNEPRHAPEGSLQHLTKEREKAIAEEILQYTASGERAEMEAAYAAGFIDESTFQREKHGLNKRYRNILTRYPEYRWNFDAKKFQKVK